ncbi:MAG: anthranilate synthase component I family protein, partial [Candidatus Omnitrophica bacterium]|nr:anthranilate synthase component I family protein [Candidatus Omnitrophota bacterium]
MDNSAYICKKLNFNAASLLNLLKRQEAGFLLDSSLDISKMGRYSFFGVEPFLVIECKDGWITHREIGSQKKFKGNIFNYLRALLDKYKLNTAAKSINFPFLGGAVGFLSYDLGFYLEKIPRKNTDDLNTADLWFAFFDTVLALDHYRNEVLIFSCGFPETDKRLRKIRAQERLKEFIKKLDGLEDDLVYKENTCCQKQILKSNFTYEGYLKAVEKSLDYITKGDIYQINLSQRFQAQTDLSDEELYLNLKKAFPVPFGGMLKMENSSIICGSPERFIQYDGNLLVTRPMKGTRRRTGNISLDRQLKKELENSSKDKAELLMIVDLERNDLGKVCDYGSVEVEYLRNMEEYKTVFQTTSQV